MTLLLLGGKRKEKKIREEKKYYPGVYTKHLTHTSLRTIFPKAHTAPPRPASHIISPTLGSKFWKDRSTP